MNEEKLRFGSRQQKLKVLRINQDEIIKLESILVEVEKLDKFWSLIKLLISLINEIRSLIEELISLRT
jgi:hypothetical protein